LHRIIDYPGVVRDPNTIQKTAPVLKNVYVPLKLHPGTLGVAPKEADMVNSIPPSYTAGNMDQCRLGEGTKLYIPVAVEKALLSMGDSHATQGDSELAGTAIEMSVTALIQVILHPQDSIRGTTLQNLDFPLFETPDEYIVQGFTYANYLAELGKNAQSEIFQKSSLDLAFKDAVNKMRQFMMNAKALTEDEAISLMSLAVDFGVTQVVDGNWGMHGILKKRVFAG
jgi:acetamidase/formamidase